MVRLNRSLVFAGALAAVSLVSVSAQAGACRDAWINNAYRDTNLGQPNGNDNRGECNTKLYGNGSWSSYDDLKNKVRAYRSTPWANGQCRDSFITQAYSQALGRSPNGKAESGDCDMYLYGNGQWGGIEDLKTKVQQYQASRGGTTPALPTLRLDLSGNLVNSAGATIALSNQIAGLISDKSGGMIGNNGSNAISENGAGLISDNGLGLVSRGATAIKASYGLQATSNGKKVIGKVTLHDGRDVTVFYK